MVAGRVEPLGGSREAETADGTGPDDGLQEPALGVSGQASQ